MTLAQFQELFFSIDHGPHMVESSVKKIETSETVAGLQEAPSYVVACIE